ncbi:hypothetical protein BJ912DRAFT_672029 [Pholiota molesta]|nr:hypothetical protein BJ912DRAFT_671933 [Pholiota molesta]KAF8178049.1 hypothetical protein BJ912DRAFT_672029 [Pholiota molesta]
MSVMWWRTRSGPVAVSALSLLPVSLFRPTCYALSPSCVSFLAYLICSLQDSLDNILRCAYQPSTHPPFRSVCVRRLKAPVPSANLPSRYPSPYAQQQTTRTQSGEIREPQRAPAHDRALRSPSSTHPSSRFPPRIRLDARTTTRTPSRRINRDSGTARTPHTRTSERIPVARRARGDLHWSHRVKLPDRTETHRNLIAHRRRSTSNGVGKS